MSTRILAFATLLLGLGHLADPATALAATPQVFRDGRARFVPGEVLVQWRAATPAAARLRALARRSSTLQQDLLSPGISLVRIARGQSVEAAVAAFRADPDVESAQPNFIYRADAIPDDPLLGQLWGLSNTGQTITADLTQPPGSPLDYDVDNPGTAGSDIRVEPAWNVITDCSSVTVAVLDSGVKYDHVDLAASMWSSRNYPLHGYDFIDGDDDPMDHHGHGTHVAGIIGAAGNNGVGVTGVCWKASIMAVRVLDSTAFGTTAAVIQGIDFAVDHGAKVINMSLGGGGYIDPAYEAAIIRARRADVVVVVSAGNDGVNDDVADHWPCSFDQPNLICVAALDAAYELASFSNFGTAAVMIGAPGTYVVSTWPGTSGRIPDPLSSGWTSTTTTSGGWSYQPLADVPTRSTLVDPSSWPTGTYPLDTDDRIYRTFDVSAADVATMAMGLAVNVTASDSFNVACKAAATTSDPFSGGTNLLSVTGVETGTWLVPTWFELPGCQRSGCSIGFQLKTGHAGASTGAQVAFFSVRTLTWNTASYATLSGTSMAVPHVAGVVTMLRAYNPAYTYADVVAAVKGGGRPVASLAGKTSTGKAVDAIGTLSFVQAPTGVTATVR